MNKYLASALIFALPAVALGQQRIGYLIEDILNFFARVVTFLGPFLISIALLAFFYSLVMYLFKREEAPQAASYLKYSILILFVMVSIWGIIAFLQQNLGIGDGRDLYKTPGVYVPSVGTNNPPRTTGPIQ